MPILNRLPRDHKFLLGDRIISDLYELHGGLINTRYEKGRAARLEASDSTLDTLRYQTIVARL